VCPVEASSWHARSINDGWMAKVTCGPASGPDQSGFDPPVAGSRAHPQGSLNLFASRPASYSREARLRR